MGYNNSLSPPLLVLSALTILRQAVFTATLGQKNALPSVWDSVCDMWPWPSPHGLLPRARRALARTTPQNRPGIYVSMYSWFRSRIVW
ncbi:hypothetical protein OH76DRAFT_322591 [Lentinus brumalis]|uniref:Secreted protein n=1 Tax=Lentinus brumalis TaxID=2498619 RepID=A0A371DFI0_9APHY|nr:hypothetical protein OH76DRAFT_322591 [Polyporus brumalis]